MSWADCHARLLFGWTNAGGVVTVGLEREELEAKLPWLDDDAMRKILKARADKQPAQERALFVSFMHLDDV